MNKEKKVIYHFDKPYFDELVSSYSYLIDSIFGLVSYVNTLGLKHSFRSRELNYVLSNTEHYLKDLEIELRAALELMVAPMAFAKMFDKEIEETIKTISQKVEVVKSAETQNRHYARYSVSIDYSLFEIGRNGDVSLPQSSIEQLKEVATIYVITENQQKAVALMDEVNDKLTELTNVISGSGFSLGIGSIVGLMSDGCEVVENNYRLKPGVVGMIQ